MFYCSTASRLQRRNGPPPRSRLSGFLAQSHLVGYLGDEGVAQSGAEWHGATLSRASGAARSGLTALLAVM